MFPLAPALAFDFSCTDTTWRYLKLYKARFLHYLHTYIRTYLHWQPTPVFCIPFLRQIIACIAYSSTLTWPILTLAFCELSEGDTVQRSLLHWQSCQAGDAHSQPMKACKARTICYWVNTVSRKHPCLFAVWKCQAFHVRDELCYKKKETGCVKGRSDRQ